ncbi:MAG: purine-nucleoside phosphorylase [Actinobacteria bacterium]|nr:purine-nucleoside phosphorylase [Actinomycetota bacterium]
MTKSYPEKLKEAYEFVRGRTALKPAIGIVLGSGLSRLADAIEKPVSIPYAEIPHFPPTTVAGHPGDLLMGRLAGVEVVVMRGRFHYYEGYSMADVALPIRLIGRLGARKLIETCAVGALRPGLSPGDLVLVVDHINMMGDNPLIGVEAEPRFVDMKDAYSPHLRSLMREATIDAGLSVKDGIYVGVSGPSYETPAEVRFLSGIADFVGMSLVPEVIVARQLGMEVTAVAVITNAHDGGYGVSHQEVLEIAEKAEADLEKLISGFIGKVR